MAIQLHDASIAPIAGHTAARRPSTHLHRLHKVEHGGGGATAQVVKNGTEALALQPVHQFLRAVTKRSVGMVRSMGGKRKGIAPRSQAWELAPQWGAAHPACKSVGTSAMGPSRAAQLSPCLPCRTSDLLLTKVEAASRAARRSCSLRSRAAWGGVADGAATEHAVGQLAARDRQHMQKGRNKELPQPPTLSSHSALMLYRRSPMGASA